MLRGLPGALSPCQPEELLASQHVGRIYPRDPNGRSEAGHGREKSQYECTKNEGHWILRLDAVEDASYRAG
jgi:hypothetical protein